MKNLIILLIAIALSQSVCAQLPTSGLVAWYPFCDNTSDYSGNGYNLTNGGAILTTDRFGYANCAYHYNGINNSMQLSGLLPLPAANFTFSCWMVADNIQDGVVVYNGNSNTDGVGVVYDAGSATPGYNVTMLDGGICFCMSVFATLHQWHHVVLRRNAGMFNLFIDTVLVSTSPSPFNTPTGIFAVGMDYTNGTNPYSGTIDDISVYNRAIADSEIKKLYHFNPDVNAFSLGNDTSFCSGSLILNSSPEPSGAIYLWSNGGSGTSISVSSAGAYWLTVDIPYGCVANDTINVNTGAASVNLGPDTTICFGSSLLLSSSSTPAGSVYLWNTGATSSSIDATTSGLYWLNVSSAGCSGTDSILVSFVSVPVVMLGNDTVVCSGISLTLQSSYSYTGVSYQWNTGEITPSITVSVTGTYWLDVTQNSCQGSDTTTVVFKPSPSLTVSNDTTICVGDSVILSALSTNGTGLIWSTGSTYPTIAVSSPGTYTVTVGSENGCDVSASVTVHGITKPLIYLGPDTALCIGDVLLLPETGGADSFLWSDGTLAPTWSVNSAGTYWATASNICGSATDTINIDYIACDLWFPTAFTPNDDGKNDVIRPIGTLGKFKDYSLSIYNRWGQRVFYSQDIYEGWNGVFNGTQQSLGTYFYMLSYSLAGKKKMLKGDFELIR